MSRAAPEGRRDPVPVPFRGAQDPKPLRSPPHARALLVKKPRR